MMQDQNAIEGSRIELCVVEDRWYQIYALKGKIED